MGKKEIMKATTINERLKELENHKGLLSISLENGRSYPGIFHTDHSKGLLKEMEAKNEWLFVVRPGFGLGWEEKIKGENIISINSNI